MIACDVGFLLSQLSLEEKVSLLAGADGWQTQEVARLGIGSLKVSQNRTICESSFLRPVKDDRWPLWCKGQVHRRWSNVGLTSSSRCSSCNLVHQGCEGYWQTVVRRGKDKSRPGASGAYDMLRSQPTRRKKLRIIQ